MNANRWQEHALSVHVLTSTTYSSALKCSTSKSSSQMKMYSKGSTTSGCRNLFANHLQSQMSAPLHNTQKHHCALHAALSLVNPVILENLSTTWKVSTYKKNDEGERKIAFLLAINKEEKVQTNNLKEKA